MRHNLGYKLLALATALIIWCYVGGPRTETLTRTIPGLNVEYRRVEPGYVSSDPPRKVKVEVQGPPEHVNAIVAVPDEVVPYVNLRGKKAGKYKLPVAVELQAGYAVSAVAIPGEITVNLERKAQRSMPVEVEFTGSPPVGHQFGPPALSPYRAIVSGVPDALKRVRRLVAVVRPGDLKSNVIEGEFPLIGRDDRGREVGGLEISPPMAHLRVEIEQAPARRVVFVSPSITGRPQFPYRVTEIEVSPQTVALTGPPERLMRITTISTSFLSLAGRTQTFRQRVRVLTPPGTSTANGGYVTVTVRIASFEDASRENTAPPSPPD